MKGFPVSVNDLRQYAQQLDFETEAGGMNKAYSGSYTNTTLNVGPTSGGVAGKALLPDSLYITATERVKLFFSLGGYSGAAPFAGTSSNTHNVWVGPSAPFTLPYSHIIREGQISFSMQVVGAAKDGVAAGTAIPFELTYGLIGRQMTDDFNFGADFIINVIGDSIAWGSGMAVKTDMWAFKLRNYYLSLGYNVRLRNWSVSGTTLLQHANSFDNGRYNYNEPGITLIALGMNDAVGNQTPDQAKANLARILNAAQARFPNHKKLVLAVSPCLDSANDAKAAAVSTALQAGVTEFSKPQVQYIAGVRTAFAPVSGTTINTDGIHPLAPGQDGIYQAVKAHVDTPANKCFEFIR